MALLRTKSELNVTAPPPSPIPTASGSRSAANVTLSEFLQKSLQVPDLALPEPATSRQQLSPEEIDLRSLASREASSVDRLLRSARQFGAFRIGCHGIPEAELRSLVKESAQVFGVLEERDTGFRRYYGGNREEIVWVRWRDERMEWAREYIGAHLYRSFSEKMDQIGSKLDAIAENLGQVFVENAAGKRFGRTMKMQEPYMSVYRYNHDSFMQPKPNSPCDQDDSSHSRDYTLSLHLPDKPCEFLLQSGSQVLSFDAGPNTIIVTVGEQLQEWSSGEFKCVSGRIIYQPDLRGCQASFSIELKWSSLSLNRSFIKRTHKNKKMISLPDQFLIALLIVFLYSMFMILGGR